MRKHSLKSKTSQNKLSERDIETTILEYLKIRGFYVWKNRTTGTFSKDKNVFLKPPKHCIRGVADILGICHVEPHKGRMISIEVKAAGGRVSEYQQTHLTEIHQRGGISLIVWSLEDVIRDFQIRGLL